MGIFPGLEAALDLTKKGPLFAVSRVARPVAARKLGEARLARWLKARRVYRLEGTRRACGRGCQGPTPRAAGLRGPKAQLVAEIASEVLRTKEPIAALDARLAELVEAEARGKIVMSLPGMGSVMTAEFLAEVNDLGSFGSADRFAAAAGIAPVLRSSGSVSFRRRAKRGNRVLVRVSIYASHPPPSDHPRHYPLPGVPLLAPRLLPEAVVAVPYVPSQLCL